MLARQIGIDLGTVNVLVYVRGKGVVLNEPSVVAIATRENRIVAVGEEARRMLGRTPEAIEVARPLWEGVIADYAITEAMLSYFISKVCGRFRLFRPEVMVSVPAGVTSVESRAVHDAAIQAGARVAYLIPGPLAAALGAGLPVDTPTGNVVMDIGGGTCEAAVISMNGIVVSSASRVGGTKIDEAIVAYVRRKYNLAIGEQTAEEIKIQIGSALPVEEELTMRVRGRDQVVGLPRSIQLSSGEVLEAITEPLSAIIQTLKSLLEKTPPELASDVLDRGIVLTGGGALLRNMDRLLSRETGIPCYVAENALSAVAIGAGKALENLEVLRLGLQPL